MPNDDDRSLDVTPGEVTHITLPEDPPLSCDPIDHEFTEHSNGELMFCTKCGEVRYMHPKPPRVGG